MSSSQRTAKRLGKGRTRQRGDPQKKPTQGSFHKPRRQVLSQSITKKALDQKERNAKRARRNYPDS